MNKKPNLIYIFADQWRRHAMGFMNEDPVITPNIDCFAKSSMVFDNAVSVFPLCTPHRGSMLTGKYPLTIGLDTNCRTGYNMGLSEDETTISDILKVNGYQTGYIGKLHLDNPDLNKNENPISGASGWDAYTPPGKRRHGFDFWYSYGAMDNHMSPHYWKDTHEKIVIKDKWSVEHETDVAIEFLEQVKEDKPFSLFISWNPPHPPYDKVPKKYEDLYENMEIENRLNEQPEKLVSEKQKLEYKMKKKYFAAVSGIDDNFGRLMNYIKDKGLEDNTIIVLSSDHGDMFGCHGFMGKHQWQEESIGIPFLINWKGNIKHKREQTVFSSIDHMPTLLGLMGLEIPESVQGSDYSSMIIGEEEGNKDNQVILTAYAGADKEKRLGFVPHSMGWRAARTKQYTYVIDKGYDYKRETIRLLYDHKKDPYQLNPLKLKDSSENNVAVQLEENIKKQLEAIKDPFFDEI